MSERMKWLEHKGKTILYADFSNLRDTLEFIKQIDAMEQEILKYKENPGTIYTITDVTNTHVNENIKKRFDEMVINTPGITRARAIVGIKGIQKIIANAIKKDVHFSGTIEEAKDWLITQ